MSQLSDRLIDEFERLKQHRDEIRVQLDLGKKEAEASWNEVEKHWVQLEGKVKLLAGEAQDAAEDVAAAADNLVDEIKEGFNRLRKLV